MSAAGFGHYGYCRVAPAVGPNIPIPPLRGIGSGIGNHPALLIQLQGLTAHSGSNRFKPTRPLSRCQHLPVSMNTQTANPGDSSPNPFKPLPKDISLGSVAAQAETFLNSVRAGNAQDIQRVGHYFGAPKKIGLDEARRVLVREYGFSTWAIFAEHLEYLRNSLHKKNNVDSNSTNVEARTEPADNDTDKGTDTELTIEQLANWFLDLVVVHYHPIKDSGPMRFGQALELLKQYPGIRSASIYTAAAIGDANQLQKWLQQSPELLNSKGGYFNWSPLMYAAYARLPGHSSFAAAQVLLQNGADPNPYYMWDGQYKFTALTGVFGEGEGGPVKQPEHPEYKQFSRALLEQGANANDSQAAYNRCFTPDNTCLEMLIEFGLNASDKNNWLLCDDDKLLPNPSETLQFHLIHGIRKGYFERVKLLVESNVDLEKPDNTYETRTKGKTPYETAMIMGQEKIARYLADNGAITAGLGPLSEFQAACCTGKTKLAKQLIEKHPELVDAARPLHGEMLCDAVKAGNRQALTTMIELGFEINDNSQRTPLHEAALEGDLDTVKFLIQAGADPKLREPQYLVPAIGYAIHAEHQDLIDYLDTASMDVFTAAVRGRTGQLEAMLTTEPELVNARFETVRPVVEGTENASHNNDWMTPLVYAVMGNREATVKLLLEKGADAAVSDANGNSIYYLAQKNGCSQNIINLLKQNL